jgi:hypothetical protein
MILVQNVEVFGFRHALRNMRNPKESWSRGDTQFALVRAPNEYGFLVPEGPVIGREDLRLLCSLERGGSEHRKVLRTIQVWLDVSPWRGMWQELDTYKVATVRNSCSTMHKLGHRDLEPSDFVDEDVELDYLALINRLGAAYRASGCKDVGILMKLKHRLPEGFVQRAGLHFNYETAFQMFFHRWNHRVPEWSWSGPSRVPDPRDLEAGRWPSFCDVLWRLPYVSVLAQSDVRWGPVLEEHGRV